jgi:hypothetical protein
LAAGYKGQDSFTLSMREHNGGRSASLSVTASVTIQYAVADKFALILTFCQSAVALHRTLSPLVAQGRRPK